MYWWSLTVWPWLCCNHGAGIHIYLMSEILHQHLLGSHDSHRLILPIYVLRRSVVIYLHYIGVNQVKIVLLRYTKKSLVHLRLYRIITVDECDIF